MPRTASDGIHESDRTEDSILMVPPYGRGPARDRVPTGEQPGVLAPLGMRWATPFRERCTLWPNRGRDRGTYLRVLGGRQLDRAGGRARPVVDGARRRGRRR